MYQNNPIEPVTPDLAKYLFDKCYEISETSTCNKRQIGAVLQLQNGIVIEGSNGSKEDSCKSKGFEYCTRDSSIGTLEFLTCPSYCAEGEAMITAYSQNYDLKNARLFTTGFPCKRCKDLIIHFGIDEVYFSEYKEGAPRFYEELYAAEMTSRGIKVFKMITDKTEYKLQELDFNPEFKDVASRTMVTPGESWIQLFFDKEYKQTMLEVLLMLKAHTHHPECIDGLVVNPIL